MKKLLPGLTILLLLAAPVLAAADTGPPWFHVKVDETKENGAQVRVNLPLSAVEAALPLIPEEHFRDGKIRIDADHDIDCRQLRQIWNELRDVPQATTLVSVQSPSESVLVTKQVDHLRVEVEDHTGEGEDVEIELPFPVVEALLSGDGDELDLVAGLRALAEYGEGDLVAVNGADEQVRVWIDRSPESR